MKYLKEFGFYMLVLGLGILAGLAIVLLKHWDNRWYVEAFQCALLFVYVPCTVTGFLFGVFMWARPFVRNRRAKEYRALKEPERRALWKARKKQMTEEEVHAMRMLFDDAYADEHILGPGGF